jgi:oligopeptide transport system substrate-binding protein
MILCNPKKLKRNKMLHRFIPFCLFSLLIACSGENTTNVESGTRDQILHGSNATEPQGLDPHIVTGLPENRISKALFESLLTRNSKTLAIEPAAAESWQISDDNLTYRFKLRDDLKWSNGEPLTAKDFHYGFRRMLHPSIASENAYNYFAIVNAEEYNTGEIEDFSQVGVTVEGNSLIIKLETETPLFLDWLTKFTTAPVHQATIEAHGNMSDRGTNWTRAENMVSNGPFTLEEWTPNKIIKVKKNPYYWDKERIKLNGIYFYPIDSQVTEERMFRDGQIHVTLAGSIPVEKIAWYKENRPENLDIYPTYSSYYYLINTTTEGLTDPRVRRALAMSIDRQLIVDRVTKGGQLPAFAVNPVNPDGYTPITDLEFNVEKARALLAEAGYPNGEGLPPIEILYNTQESHRQIALVIQQMWKQNLNIETTLTNQEWKVYLDNRRQLNYQIARAGSSADVTDPSDFLNSFTSDSGMNDTGWGIPEYDKLILRGLSISDLDERYKVFQQAEKLLMEEVPVIPIYYYTRIKLKSTDIKNMNENMLDYPSYKDIYLSDE